MNNRMSYADMFHEAMQETKRQIDQYFDKKVKEFEDKTTSKGYVPYVDPYPEELYDGNAMLVEELTPTTETKFTYIPAWVIVNEGLTGDPFGKSDIEALIDDESWYSKLSSKDIDSLNLSVATSISLWEASKNEI